MERIQWFGVHGHERTDEERLYALKWCEKQRVRIFFDKLHVHIILPGRRTPIIAYDLADCVKAAIENYGMPE